MSKLEIPGVDKILLFNDVKQSYNFSIEGSNDYYALRGPYKHYEDCRQYLKKHLDALTYIRDHSNSDSPIAVLGLEPEEKGRPFEYILNNLDIITNLAKSINQLQENNKFRVVIRFASEMNCGGNNWGPSSERPDWSGLYKKAIGVMRNIFRKEAPKVPFCFSPTILSVLDENGTGMNRIKKFWPEDANNTNIIDIISCTWYINGTEQEAGATDFLDKYINWAVGLNKKLAIDEICGRTNKWVEEDPKREKSSKMLVRMFDHIGKRMAQTGKSLEYATIFIADPKQNQKWNIDLSDLEAAYLPGQKPNINSKPIIRGIVNRYNLTISHQYALEILELLSVSQLNRIKGKLQLGCPGVIGTQTLDSFALHCAKKGIILDKNGIADFKTNNNLDNTGLNKGKIGINTALAVYDMVI
ncbi:MAG: hypothetical protein LWY06_03110 [Firmicutes bacterium]|nr:hypothetical protein [Bacillota bacterium]